MGEITGTHAAPPPLDTKSASADDKSTETEASVASNDPLDTSGAAPTVITPDMGKPSDEPHVVDSAKDLEPYGDNVDYVGPRKEVARDYSIAQEADPQRRRPGADLNGYADREQRVRAEIIRAQVEGREPDLENPPPSAGTPLKPTEVLKEQFPTPGADEIPVNVVVPQVIGTDDPDTLRPEDKELWENEKRKGGSDE